MNRNDAVSLFSTFFIDKPNDVESLTTVDVDYVVQFQRSGNKIILYLKKKTENNYLFIIHFKNIFRRILHIWNRF